MAKICYPMLLDHTIAPKTNNQMQKDHGRPSLVCQLLLGLQVGVLNRKRDSLAPPPIHFPIREKRRDQLK
ncbi:hypothetical protein NC653_015711 [Populus alba x Populus x berolinensis]|uniref:Uncharacterized protein n=1 Tax=Populus alba x Populus x berolinensis TaxID=444605 RepID=A0AAD6QL46_9ROSI|nr:hypothetical protein NC653_015711 [Populus alba x Populus x berolinensis]